MIERADSIVGWMSIEELTWLARQARRHSRILEVGSWLGRSTAALSDNTEGVVYAVDTFLGSPETNDDPSWKDHPEPWNWLWEEFKKNAAENIIPARMQSVEAAAMFAKAGETFDMIFIDGAHDTESVKADIKAWRPLLAPGGLLCGHDYFTTVKEAVDELIPRPMIAAGTIWKEAEDLLPCAILVPSLNRPQNIRRTVESIHESTPEEHFILFAVSDVESMDILDELGEWYLDDSDGEDRRYVTRMNKLIDHLDDAKTMFFGSDDVIHHPGWLTNTLRLMQTGPRCVVMNDMHNMAGTQAVIHREYLKQAVFDAPGLAFHPGYKHNFADNEMFFTASMRGELAWANDAIVEHLHPAWESPNAAPWDDTYKNAQAGWTEDEVRWRGRHDTIEKEIIPVERPIRKFWGR